MRITADNTSVNLGANWPSHSSWTITCWAKISVDRNAASCLFDVVDTAGELYMETATDGVTMRMHDGSNDIALNAALVNRWYFYAMRKNGADLAGYMSVVDGGRLTKVTATATITTSGMNGFRLGKEEFNASTFFNGCINHVKWWAGALTDDEILAEQFHSRPQRAHDLNAWWPLMSRQEFMTDLSGRGRNLTPGAGVVRTEAGPSVVWL